MVNKWSLRHCFLLLLISILLSVAIFFLQNLDNVVVFTVKILKNFI